MPGFTGERWSFDVRQTEGGKARVAFHFALSCAPGHDVSVRLSGPRGTISGLRAKPDPRGVLEFSFRLSLIGAGQHTIDLYDDGGEMIRCPFTIP